MSKYLAFDTIFESYEQNHDDCIKEALDYARDMVWCEIETSEQTIAYADYIDTVDGVGVYYCYGADHFFFTDETGE